MGSGSSSNPKLTPPLTPLSTLALHPPSSSSSAMATPAHCHYCFEVLTSHLYSRPTLSLPDIEALYAHQQQQPLLPTTPPKSYSTTTTSPYPKTPLFITWKKRSSTTTTSSSRLDLRGCIGTFEKKPLETGLADYALTAGLHDTRFSPITAAELPLLECGVTLLTDFEPAENPMDWTLGVHGLQIDFVYHHRRMGATYLPDVPLEQGWTREETLVSLMRKAGWTGRRDEWKKIALRVTRYKGSKSTVSWEEYRKLMEGPEEDEGGEYVVANGHK